MKKLLTAVMMVLMLYSLANAQGLHLETLTFPNRPLASEILGARQHQMQMNFNNNLATQNNILLQGLVQKRLMEQQAQNQAFAQATAQVRDKALITKQRLEEQWRQQRSEILQELENQKQSAKILGLPNNTIVAIQALIDSLN